MNRKQVVAAWSIILSYNTVFILLSTIAHASVTPTGVSTKSPPEATIKNDNNKDGKPDEIYEKEGNMELLKEDTDSPTHNICSSVSSKLSSSCPR